MPAAHTPSLTQTALFQGWEGDMPSFSPVLTPGQLCDPMGGGLLHSHLGTGSIFSLSLWRVPRPRGPKSRQGAVGGGARPDPGHGPSLSSGRRSYISQRETLPCWLRAPSHPRPIPRHLPWAGAAPGRSNPLCWGSLKTLPCHLESRAPLPVIKMPRGTDGARVRYQLTLSL